MSSIPGGGLPPLSPSMPSIPSGSGATSSSVGSPDTVNSSIQLSTAFLDTSSSASLISIVKAVGDVRQALREALNKSMSVNSTITSGFTLGAAQQAGLIITEFMSVISTVNNWNSSIQAQGQAVVDSFPPLATSRNNLNNLISNTQSTDEYYINLYNYQNPGNANWINNYLGFYKNPTTFNAWALTNFPSGLKDPAQALAASQQSGINFMNNNVIGVYNGWFNGSRPNLQNALNNYNNTINSYNNSVIDENNRIATINQERQSYGMPPLQMLQTTETPSSSINTYLTYSNSLPSSLPYLSLPPNSTAVNYLTVFPSPSNVVSLPPLTNPLAPGQLPPRAPITEAFVYLFNNFIDNLIAYITGINRMADLFQAQADRESEVFRRNRIDITVSNAYVSQQTRSNASESGVGLSSFAMGLQTKNLQLALANSIFRTVALNTQKPIPERLFAQLEFSTLELLQNSSLLSAIPAMRSVASSIGLMASSTASMQVPIAFAILEQIGALIDSTGQRGVVNTLLNQLPQYARLRSAVASGVVALAQQGLKEAVGSGDGGRIDGAINLLANARVVASRAQELKNAFGHSSIGDIANLTNATSAAMALSLLSVGLALLGSSIGILDLPAQLLGGAGGAPLSEIQGFMAGGASITDALDNPLGVLALKENLISILSGKGFGANAADLVNSAIGQVIAQGGTQGLSDLKAALFQAFKDVLNPVQAHGLANQAATILFGNLGFPYANAAFGINYPLADILPMLAHNGSMGATNAQAILEESLKAVGNDFQAQGQFRDALYQNLQDNGISASQAMYFANGVATFGLTGTAASVYDVSANYLDAIQKSTEGKLSEQLGLSQADANRLYDQAKAAVLQQGPLNTIDQFHVLMMEELNKATNGIVAAQIYRSAVSEADTAHELVKQDVLKDKVRNNAVEILQPELGLRVAEEIAHKIVAALFGTGSLNEAEKHEKHYPLSALNRAEKALSDLKKDIEDKALKNANEKIAEMIAVWVKPNAELGFLLQSLMDKPSTFIGSLVGPQKPKGEFLDIPV